MGLRFRKSIKIAKGVKLNVGKSSLGLSLGTKGVHYSINTTGRSAVTVGLPGTGLSYSKTLTGKRKKKSSTSSRQGIASGTQGNSENASIVEEYESYVEDIQTVHLYAMDSIDWRNFQVPMSSIGRREAEAREAYEAYNPGFIAGIMGDSKKKELKQAIDEARRADQEEREALSNIKSLSEKVLNGDIDAYLNVIGELNPFDDLVDYGSGFEFGTDDPSYMEIEFQVKSRDVVPNTVKSLTKTGKLSEKDMTKTKYYEITQDYVCSACIRLARDIFAMLPVRYVLVHAMDTEVDSRTGRDRDFDILSVRFDREGFQNIDFSRIDPSDFLETFEHNEKFMKTSGFREIERLS